MEFKKLIHNYFQRGAGIEDYWNSFGSVHRLQNVRTLLRNGKGKQQQDTFKGGAGIPIAQATGSGGR